MSQTWNEIPFGRIDCFETGGLLYWELSTAIKLAAKAVVRNSFGTLIALS